MDEQEDPRSRRIYKSLDEAFEEIGRYGRYQLFCFLVIQYTCISSASQMIAGFFRLGGLVPDYECNDPTNTFYLKSDEVRRDPARSCLMVKSCANIVTHNSWTSIYEEFMWVCEPDYIGSTISSLLPLLHLVSHFVSGHLSDYLGRKKIYVFGMAARLICGIAESFAPTWQSYIMLNVISHFLGVLPSSAAFTLVVETVHSQDRMIQSFAFQYSIGFIVAGIVAYVVGHWRRLLLFMNVFGLPSLVLLSFFVESPRFLLQSGQYERAASALNRIAWFNGKDTRFTAEDMSVIRSFSTSHAPRNKKYSVWHLFSNWRLASYSISQMITGISLNILQSVVFFNMQDLSGNPLVNVSLMGLLRLWTPFAAILLDTKFKNFGRKRMMVGSLGLTTLSFFVMLVIDVLEMSERARAIGTAAVLFGYVIQAGFVWIVYKLYSAELFPTVIRSIALSTFSIAAQLGSIIGPQLIYVRKYWHPAPYLAAVVVTFLATILAALFLPETKSEPLHDSVHDAKRRLLAFEQPPTT